MVLCGSKAFELGVLCRHSWVRLSVRDIIPGLSLDSETRLVGSLSVASVLRYP